MNSELVRMWTRTVLAFLKVLVLSQSLPRLKWRIMNFNHGGGGAYILQSFKSKLWHKYRLH
jgi:hypothetical protein